MLCWFEFVVLFVVSFGRLCVVVCVERDTAWDVAEMGRETERERERKKERKARDELSCDRGGELGLFLMKWMKVGVTVETIRTTSYRSIRLGEMREEWSDLGTAKSIWPCCCSLNAMTAREQGLQYPDHNNEACEMRDDGEIAGGIDRIDFAVIQCSYGQCVARNDMIEGDESKQGKSMWTVWKEWRDWKKIVVCRIAIWMVLCWICGYRCLWLRALSQITAAGPDNAGLGSQWSEYRTFLHFESDIRSQSRTKSAPDRTWDTHRTLRSCSPYINTDSASDRQFATLDAIWDHPVQLFSPLPLWLTCTPYQSQDNLVVTQERAELNHFLFFQSPLWLDCQFQHFAQLKVIYIAECDLWGHITDDTPYNRCHREGMELIDVGRVSSVA